MRKSFEKVPEPVNPSRIVIISVLAGLSMVACESHKKGANDTEGEVTHVVDGDTFDVTLDNGDSIRVRPWGVDCPESRENEKCLKKGKRSCENEVVRGQEAKVYTQDLLDGAKVTLEPPFEKNGNRTLAYVRLKNGEDFSRKLIARCLCREGYQHDRKAEYKRVAQGCRGK